MRMVLLAALSCILVGSVNGMEEMDRSIISPRVKTAIKTTGKHVGDFAQGYALGSAAGFSFCTITIFGPDDNVGRGVIGGTLAFAGAVAVGLKGGLTMPGGKFGDKNIPDKYRWRRALYVAGGMSGMTLATLLYAYSLTNYQERCESDE